MLLRAFMKYLRSVLGIGFPLLSLLTGVVGVIFSIITDRQIPQFLSWVFIVVSFTWAAFEKHAKSEAKIKELEEKLQAIVGPEPIPTIKG